MSPECELQALGWIGAPREVCIEPANTAPPAEPRARAAAAAVSSLSDFAKTIGLAPGVLDNVIVTKKNADPDEEDAAKFFAPTGLLPRPTRQTGFPVEHCRHCWVGWMGQSTQLVRGLSRLSGTR